jgi:hypothetical protein
LNLTVEAKLGKIRALLVPGSRDDDDITLLSELLSLPSSAADLNLSPRRKREKLHRVAEARGAAAVIPIRRAPVFSNCPLKRGSSDHRGGQRC